MLGILSFHPPPGPDLPNNMLTYDNARRSKNYDFLQALLTQRDIHKPFVHGWVGGGSPKVHIPFLYELFSKKAPKSGEVKNVQKICTWFMDGPRVKHTCF